jgi:hypothetical protein
MSGGKGGSQTQQVQIPAWMEDVAKRNLARAESISKVGYMPYYGTDVVGFGPTGDMARQANIDAAIAYGMAPEGTRATPIGDMSSGTLYDQAVAEYERRNPGAASYYNQFFIDPVTGAAPAYDQAIAEQAARDEMLRQGRIPPVLYGGDGRDESGNPVGGLTVGQIQGFANKDLGMMRFLPGASLAQALTRGYVNYQAKDPTSDYYNTGAGFSDGGGTYTTSTGREVSTSGMSPETRAGLEATTAESSYGFGD